jgi:short subunit dehydrogenase
MRGLDSKVAVVAGGGSGIGAATAERLAEEGASVVVGDIVMPNAEVVADSIRAAGGTAVAAEFDIAEDESVARLDLVGIDTNDLVTEDVASQPWRFHPDERLGSASYLNAPPDTRTEWARLLRHGVIDDERCPRASLDVMKLPARAESRAADVDRSIGVEPITDRNDIRSIVGADRGETSKLVSDQVFPFLLGEDRVHAARVPTVSRLSTGSASAPELPICARSRYTERAHRTLPDERHRRRPIGTSDVPRSVIGGARSRGVPGGSSITRQSLRCIRRDRSDRKIEEKNREGSGRRLGLTGNQALFAAATSTKTSTRTPCTQRILLDA